MVKMRIKGCSRERPVTASRKYPSQYMKPTHTANVDKHRNYVINKCGSYLWNDCGDLILTLNEVSDKPQGKKH